MTTQTAEFYRRQAANFLAQAEVIERLAPLGAVPAKTVISFDRGAPGNTPHTYAAIVIETDEIGTIYSGRKWFVTHAQRSAHLGPWTDEEFIKWLMDGDAKDIKVVTGYTPLEQWYSIKDLDGAYENDDATKIVQRVVTPQ